MMNCNGCGHWRGPDGKRQSEGLKLCHYYFDIGHCRLDPPGECTHYNKALGKKPRKKGGRHKTEVLV